jgi:hypothetical protein
MAFLKSRTAIALAGTALATAIGFSAAPGFGAAATTWTISPGGAFTAKAKSATLKDVTASRELACTSSTLKGRLKSGHGHSGASAGSVTGFTLTGCTVAHVAAKVTPGHLPWHLNLVSYSSAKGVTTATLSGIHLAMSVPSLSCSAIIDGTKATADNGQLKLTYTNKTHGLKTMVTGGNLHLYRVSSGCLGAISNGDSIAIITAYPVSPKQTIKHP